MAKVLSATRCRIHSAVILMVHDPILQNALQSIFDNMHAFIFLKDTENRLIKVNKRVAESHGLNPEDMAGHHSRDFYGEQADLYFEDDKAVIRSGTPKLNIIEPLPLGEGNLRWIETSKIPVCDARGTVIGILVIASDITDKREAEQDLAESRNLLETIVENFDESLGLYGPDKRLRFGNPTFWRLHEQAGWQDVVRIGASFDEIAKAIAPRLAKTLNKNDPRDIEKRFLDNYRDPRSHYHMPMGERMVRVQRYPTPDGGRVVFGYDVTERWAADQALRDSEARFRDFAESASDWFWETDADLRITWLSPKVREITGLPPERFYGRKREEIVDTSLDPSVWVEYQQAIEERKPFRNIVYRMKLTDPPASDRPMVWVRINGIPFFAEDDTFLGYRGIVSDVTKEKHAEQALRESEARFRDFAEAASDWFWEMDADLRFTRIAGKVRDFTGVPAEQYYGRTRAEMVDTSLEPENWAAFQKTVDDRKPFRDFVYRLKFNDFEEPPSSMVWARISGSPIFADDGTFLGYRGTGADATKEKLAERALKESEARYQTLAKLAPVGIFRTDHDARCTYTNDLWHAMTGVAPGAATGLCWTEAFHPEDRQELSTSWRETALSEGTFHAECRTASVTGEDCWVLVTVAPEQGQDGRPSGFVGSLTDISKLKRIETQLRHTEQELREHRDQLELLVERRTAALRDAQQSLLLQERLAAIGQLTATVSHELRNPLGTITTSFAALKRRIDCTDEKVNRIAERIERNVARCGTIIEDLLNYTRVKTLNRELLELDSWLAQLASEFELPPGVAFESHLRSDSEVRIDRARMRQVISNLVGNAVDAMKDAPGPGHTLELVTERKGAELVILLRDSGSGVEPAELDRVFEPLVSTKTFGVGLGLPLVRQIIELHGGTVEIRNRETQGAEVIIVLPREPDDEARETNAGERDLHGR